MNQVQQTSLQSKDSLKEEQDGPKNQSLQQSESQNFKKGKGSEEKVVGILKFLQYLISTKTSHCKHNNPDCMTNAVEGLLTNMKHGVAIRGVMTFLMILLGKQKMSKINFKDQLRFPVFLGLFAFISKFVLCLFRRLRNKDDGLNSFMAGFLGGVSLLVQKDKSTRTMFALYLTVRAYDSSYLTLESKEIIPNIPNFHMVFICIINVVIVYLFFTQRERFSFSYFQMIYYLFSIHKDPNDHIMQDILTKICQKGQ
ncbi:UNKNOWN [Stylonychia lemnae]|uniref:Transmembrane protein 135 N-terminal domain-containing protein n=1 Tax=Stylonychia lemnae TaxID=5949 RepID=A0A077ZXW1_STYLE|nr:UNKNOWN [Stylonychia lemnae]|eukprot:CDW74746.1 UNKNOWN [Stylonychia lemnae]